ncbi:glycerol-3-phosphate dehydrogenase [Alkalimarinus sediminis]|uniref:Glycerol-3-phosphate dehydrogenase n=1 Tax=Alkalimarinus sediminis TaxID=1632866 RepID=A0A9E8HFL1_9ALTE|nr:glycerol-3-phosphate dehydrogenase [Alkalimarinus sediminis]UZW73539.1 glycerol-3-phosphate dehydrogenase [Alkalimarinus sediminis]
MISLTSNTVDIFVVGGGINGVGIAADAAGRGLSVTLCEQADLASATSSASSKLIHGGLRYLEHYEFSLVKKALAEREVLLHNAPHLVQPLRFTLPHRPHLRPGWMIRSGLFMYDHLTKRNTLPSARSFKFKLQSPLKPAIKKGYQYYDCSVDDARLVITNAILANRLGANILTRTKLINATRLEDEAVWKVTLLDQETKQEHCIFAKALVNAAGPWVSQLVTNYVNQKPAHNIRLIKGSHIVVPKFHNHEGAFILQNTDKRIVFVIPYQENFSLIGTTDKAYTGDPATVEIDSDEVQYLIDVVNEHFIAQISKDDIVKTFAGVRPLCDDESSDPSAMTRDYTLELEEDNSNIPLLSIYGGKITTYRTLAETAMNKLSPYFPNAKDSWTATSPLPGATPATRSLKDIQDIIHEAHPWLPPEIATRYSHSYGLLCLIFLGGRSSTDDMGRHFGANLYQCEVDYLIKKEWAKTVEDILWRRTKLSLVMNSSQTQALENYLSHTFHESSTPPQDLQIA